MVVFTAFSMTDLGHKPMKLLIYSSILRLWDSGVP